MKAIIKQLGIWMDHEVAHIIDLTDDTACKTITSHFTHSVKEDALSKNESLMHHKEQHQQAEYYKQLSEVVRQYQDVLLFGPTQAKAEFYNSIKENHLFSKIKIDVKPADKMSTSEQHLFVKNHFLKSLKPIQ